MRVKNLNPLSKVTREEVNCLEYMLKNKAKKEIPSLIVNLIEKRSPHDFIPSRVLCPVKILIRHFDQVIQRKILAENVLIQAGYPKRFALGVLCEIVGDPIELTDNERIGGRWRRRIAAILLLFSSSSIATG